MMTDEIQRAPVPLPGMTNIRAQIDRLTPRRCARWHNAKKLIAAGQVKPRRDQVRDPARIEEVVRLVLENAQQEGLAAEIAELVWRQLIEAPSPMNYRFLTAVKTAFPA